MSNNEAAMVTGPPAVAAALSLKEQKATWRMTRGERNRYQLGYAGWTAGAAIITTFMTLFLVFQGVSLTTVATLILIVKIIDALDDVVFGYVIDRINPTQIRFLRKLAGTGKYLPWYRVTFFLLPASVVVFFAMPSGLPDVAKVAWFAVAYLIFDFACTLSQVPMQSMVLTLTDRVSERDNILKIRGVILILVAVVGGLVWQFSISEFVGLPIAGVAIGSAVLTFLLMLPLSRKVKEHNVELKNVDEEKTPNYSLREMFQVVRTNRYMLLILATDITQGISATQLATGMFAAFYLFGNSMVLTLPVLIAFIPGLILQFFADRIAHALGKRNAIVGFGLLGAAASITLFLIGPGNLFVVVALMSVGAIPTAVNVVLRTFLIPDTIEYTRYKTGQDCAGIFFALDSFVQKAVAGVAASLAFFVLGIGGWRAVEGGSFADLAAAGATQPDSALTALWLTVTIIPACGALASAIILMFYRLRDADASLMAKCNSGEITRAECEAQLSRAY
ncbi:MFS transporter [Microbacterium hominis]|uniref:MFS transporter n=2 Tax=Microbacterium hominis TaxID=162426 RepID=A0A7D4Q052_9MICO|nr:MFS transporter [Microbacterium hominis]